MNRSIRARTTESVYSRAKRSIASVRLDTAEICARSVRHFCDCNNVSRRILSFCSLYGTSVVETLIFLFVVILLNITLFAKASGSRMRFFPHKADRFLSFE